MTRLVHSQGGFIRSLQMSSARFFAFVEGRLDRAFFDRLLQQAFPAGNIRHQVIAMKELPPGTGGKSALISTFRDFRRRGLLRMSAFGKTMACVFLADKDSDDFCRKQLRSPHFIYSPSYDLEAHLYSCADLHRALADSCGITLHQAQSLMPDPKGWLLHAADMWKDWVALCLVSQQKGINCGCTFDRVSQINPDPFALPDAAQLETFKVTLCQRLGISNVQFGHLYALARRRVDASVAAGQPMRYFKGKWLSHLVQRFLESRPRPPDANFSGVGERLCSTLVAQVAIHAHCPCCAPYTAKLNAVAAGL